MKNLKILIVLLISIIAIGSCSKEDFVQKMEVRVADPFELKINHVATINDTDLEIKVIDVLEDSRCPIGAVCAWEGQVKLEVEITLNNHTTTKEMVARLGKDIPTQVGEYNISVPQVTPDRQIDEGIELIDYTFTFFIEKN